MSNFEVVEYDVWGNEEDGYVVNDVFRTGNHISLNECELESDVLLADALTEGLICFRKASDLRFGGDSSVIYVNEAYTGKPLFELRLEQIT
ncbi:MAG: hypothetical protein MN733_17435 [Nitrososphaera sp.]|nr:hypothetical protein [Nitrososphaera sp.]